MTTTLLLLFSGSASATPVADARCHMLVRLDDSSRVDVVDVQTGAVTTAVDAVALDATGLRGLARSGDTLLVCSGGLVQSISLADGTLTPTLLDCAGLAGGDSLVLLGGGIESASVYGDTAAAVAGTVTASASVPLRGTHTAAANGDEILTAFHSSTLIRRWSISSGEFVSSLSLEGVDLPIWGLSVVGGVLYVLDDGRQEDGTRAAPEVLAFDLSDGALVASASLPDAPAESPRGLHCAAP